MREIPNFDLGMSSDVSTRESLIYYVRGRRLSQMPRVGSADQFKVMKEICNYLPSKLGARSSIVSKDLKESRDNGFTYDDGKGSKKPPPKYSEINIKDGVPHKNFQQRKRAGEIMMSNYDRIVLSVTQYPGVKGKPETSGNTLFRISWGALEEAGAVTLYHDPDWPWPIPLVMGKYLLLTRQQFVVFYYYRYTAYDVEWVYPPELTAGTVYNAAMGHIIDPTSLVTNVLKKANMSSVDVLTAMAELPKSVSSAFAGVKLVSKVLRDFKKKEFNLTKAYQRREAKFTADHRRRLAKIDRRLRQDRRLSKKKRAELEEYRNRLFVGHRELLKRSADELASETASLWLNYRYNIMPNVYLAQDILDATEKFGRQFVTAKGTVRDDGILSIGPFAIHMDTVQRCVLKRKFSASVANNGLSVISNDIFTTAWELVPLSFVYDWFINFGDVIAARSYNFSWDQQQCSLSKKIHFADTITVVSQSDFVEPPTTRVSGTIYERRIINPFDCIGLVWQPSLSLERQLDAISLAWRPVRSLLHKGNKQ